LKRVLGKIMKSDFGKMEDGRAVELYTIRNDKGLEMTVTNYGGIIVSLKVPDREGRIADVVLGFDNFQSYRKENPYFGAIIGRYANRIGKASFFLNGKHYSLASNSGDNHLHGGESGFDNVLWEGKYFARNNATGVELTYLSMDGEEGYPGNLSTKVTYSLDNDNRLKIEYEATTDHPTICNLTHHSYFNLAGHDSGSINSHVLMIRSSRFTLVDTGLIPTGELRNVAGTPFDFRKAKRIGTDIDQASQQLTYGMGYDHNWVLDRQSKKELELVATLYEPNSGRLMEVWTEEPGLQFYSGNSLNGTLIGKGGHTYQQRAGLCLETQHFPDSPNKPNFPSVTLNPGEVYKTQTVYRFLTK